MMLMRYILVALGAYLLGSVLGPRKIRKIIVDIQNQSIDLAEDIKSKASDVKDIASDSLAKSTESLKQAAELSSQAVTNLSDDLHKVAKTLTQES